ncbi:MAG: transporter substrate-binding domain-containing protein [Chthoniobacterales bacterium]|nr:transporter substrate-binding domain-containing protein [Chthoniobacterales bacterium]
MIIYSAPRASRAFFGVLLTALFTLSAVVAAHAQEPAPPPAASPRKPLTVVTRTITPFVIEKNGRLAGYSIELWGRVVREARLPFDPDTGYKVVENVTQMLDELRSGRANAGVAAVSITSEREKAIDFSYPFKESGLQILTKEQPGSSFSKIVGGLFKGDILWLLGGLFIVLLLNSHIIWFLERKKNAESFPEGYVAGIWEAVWWSICTIITGGCENKAPLGVAGRLTAIVWMLAGAALFTYITATITSAMTVDTLNSDIQSVADLKSRKWSVGTLSGSTAQAFLERQGLTVTTYPDVEAACAALADDKVKAVIYDAPMLLYYAKNNPDKQLGVVGELFEKQSYGIGVPQGSPYRKEITRAILALREQGFFEELENKYFGTGIGGATVAAK